VHLTGYVAVLRRWWWGLLIAAWAAGIGAYVVASTIPPTYETTARMLVGPVNADLDTLRAAGALAATYSELAMSQPVMEEALEATGNPGPPIAVRATSDETTRFVTLRVEHTDPAVGAAIADAIGDSLIRMSRSPTARPEGLLTVIDAAQPAEFPIAPRVELITGLAAMTGLVAALLLILLAELLGDRIKDPTEIDDAGVPLLGALSGRRSRDQAISPIVESAPESRAALAYHQLAGRIQILAEEHGLKSILLFGVDPGEHVGEVAVNTALVLGRMGRRVALVDANREEREIDRLMKIAPRRGLSSVLWERGTDLAEAGVQRSGIVVIPYGIADQRDLVALDVASRIIGGLQAAFDLVLITSAAPDHDPNSLVWGRAVDGVVLVLHQEHTRRRQLAAAVESLKLSRSNLLGAAFYRTGTRAQQSTPKGQRSGAGATAGSKSASAPVEAAPKRIQR
jgi:succinoglycan biosynthesis transport protein ExoP